MKHLLLAVANPVVVLLTLRFWSRLHPRVRALCGGALLVLFLVSAQALWKLTALAIRHTPEWDFDCFWLYGHVALSSHAIYSPAALHAAAGWRTHGADWVREVLDTGFIYPPPSILLFAPLGFFASTSQAMAFWYVLLYGALAGAIVVLTRTFFSGWLALAGVAILAIGFLPTQVSLAIGQTLAFLLLFVSLMMSDRHAVRRGVWLGLACIVKPLATVLIVEPILRRAWTEVAVAVATVVAGFLGAMALVGPANVLAYFTNGPMKRFPAAAILEKGNQSLWNATAHLTGLHPSHFTLLGNPVFLVLAAVLAAVTVWCCVVAKDRALSIALLVVLALVLYPNSRDFYGVLLLVPLLFVWQRFGAKAPYWAAAFVALQYAVAGRWPDRSLEAWMFAWLVLAAAAIYGASHAKARSPRPAAPAEAHA